MDFEKLYQDICADAAALPLGFALDGVRFAGCFNAVEKR